jgi:hypothetical protein
LIAFKGINPKLIWRQMPPTGSCRRSRQAPDGDVRLRFRQENQMKTQKVAVRKVMPERTSIPMRRSTPEVLYLSATQVLGRYGNRRLGWLNRLLENDPSFPKPIQPGRFRLWSIKELEIWERRLVAASVSMKGEHYEDG